MSFKLLKNILIPIITLIIFLEIIFQILSFSKSNLISKPILFFNPYCDQEYWNFQKQTQITDKSYEYHPILSLVKKNKSVPISVEDIPESIKGFNETVFYGSSFIDHSEFIRNFKNIQNYAVKSYGLDQIFQSYMLTKHKHYGDNIVVGFLLEDLDRVLFSSRNYEKLRFKKIAQNFEMENIPIKLENQNTYKFYFYTYYFLKSIIFLVRNDYDYKKSECSITFKKDLFNYFIKQIQKNTIKYNQTLTFITFNFKEDFINNSNWRYNFIKEKLKNSKINHIDTKDIILKHKKKYNNKIEQYFSEKDLHYNRFANGIISKEIKNSIEQYK